MEFEKVGKHTVLLLRLRTAAAAAGIFFIVGGLYVFLPIVSVVLGAILIVLMLAVLFWYIPAYYRVYRYKAEGTRLLIEKGAIITKVFFVDLKKVQYLEFFSSPLQKKLKLCTILFHTAGAIVLLSNIEYDSSTQIREMFNKCRKDE